MFSFPKKLKKLHFDETSTTNSSLSNSSFDHPLTPIDGFNAKQVNVLIIGQIYEDTVLTVNNFPEKDTKVRTNHKQQCCGGRGIQTAKILAQFPKMTPYIMSSVGSKEASAKLVAELESKGVKTSTCFFRKSPTPSNYIIQCKNTGSRTVISYNTTQDITKDEFVRKVEMSRITKTIQFEYDCRTPFSWVHFEGRNVFETAAQIDWLELKATREGWRHALTISVELDKADRHNIDILLTRGDVVFFSKSYAKERGYDEAEDFLKDFQARCRPGAILFCTWGTQGATCLSSKGDTIHSSAKVQVVDSVGAGDTFIAGVIYCMSRGHTLLTTLKLSWEMTSRKLTRFGFDGLASVMTSAELANASTKNSSFDNAFDFGTLTSKRSDNHPFYCHQA